jgi:3-keto-disaccharide hydrolase
VRDMPFSRAFLCCCAFAAASLADDWKPLWDGRSLKGWHAIGKGEWEVQDGAIVGRHRRSEMQFGHLVTDAIFADFTVRIVYKTVSGNSGLYFRTDESGFSGVSGLQAQIDPQNDTGGLYETNGRAWLVKPRAEAVSEWFKPGEWNEMIVIARGTKVLVTVNGQKSAEIDDDQGRRKGRIALQLHGAQQGLIYFKKIDIQGEPVSE